MRGLLGELISEKHQMTVADMEAGLEHLSRSNGTLRHIDVLLVVLEPYRKALETARRTRALAAELGIPRILGVGSKIRDASEAADVEAFASEVGLPLLGVVPFDDAVRRADREGVAVVDIAPESRAVQAVDRLLEAVEREWAAV